MCENRNWFFNKVQELKKEDNKNIRDSKLERIIDIGIQNGKIIQSYTNGLGQVVVILPGSINKVNVEGKVE